jgi:hypothetical protein
LEKQIQKTNFVASLILFAIRNKLNRDLKMAESHNLGQEGEKTLQRNTLKRQATKYCSETGNGEEMKSI